MENETIIENNDEIELTPEEIRKIEIDQMKDKNPKLFDEAKEFWLSDIGREVIKDNQERWLREVRGEEEK